jgi:hypothetical protein
LIIDPQVTTPVCRQCLLRQCFRTVHSVFPEENLPGRSTYYGAPALLMCRSGVRNQLPNLEANLLPQF